VKVSGKKIGVKGTRRRAISAEEKIEIRKKLEKVIYSLYKTFMTLAYKRKVI